MKIYTLHRQQLIRGHRTEVFAFFERPENLQKITPPSVRFEMLTPLPVTLRRGAVLDYTIRIFGLPVQWRTLIESYDPPRFFVDIALKGPYRFWHHTHTFEDTGDGTEMIDTVHYALPGGPLGRIVHALWVRRQLGHIFNYRAQVIAGLFGSPADGRRSALGKL